MDHPHDAPLEGPKSGKPRPAYPVGAIVFGLLLAAVIGAYAYSILDTARRTTDWLLIGPVAAIGLIALAVAVLDDVRQHRSESSPSEVMTDGRIGAALVVAVLVYAGAVAWIGFDVGTALFVAVALVLQGERRVLVVVPTALLTSGVLVYLFRHVMGVPLPSLLI